MNINEENVNLIINLLSKEVESLREQLAAALRDANVCRSDATELREKVSSLCSSIQSYAGQATCLKSALKPGELQQLFPTYQDAAKHLAAQYSQERILAIRALRHFTRGVEGYPIGLKEAKDMIEKARDQIGLNKDAE